MLFSTLGTFVCSVGQLRHETREVTFGRLRAFTRRCGQVIEIKLLIASFVTGKSAKTHELRLPLGIAFSFQRGQYEN